MNIPAARYKFWFLCVYLDERLETGRIYWKYLSVSVAKAIQTRTGVEIIVIESEGCVLINYTVWIEYNRRNQFWTDRRDGFFPLAWRRKHLCRPSSFQLHSTTGKLIGCSRGWMRELIRNDRCWLPYIYTIVGTCVWGENILAIINTCSWIDKRNDSWKNLY